MGSPMIHVCLIAALSASFCAHAAPVSGGFVVSANPLVVVRRSHTVTLPCWVSPPQSTDSLEVKWYRGTQFDSPVLHYRSKKLEDTRYAGRTSFGLKDPQSAGLTAGDVSLRLATVTLEDAGDYTCYVSSDQDYDSQNVKLTVTEAGSPVLMSARPTEDNAVNVSCESAGWYPQPSLRWSDQKQVLKPKSLQYSNDSSGLLTVHSWLLISHPSEVSCSVGPPGEESKEARLRLDNLPQQASGSSAAGWVAFGLLLTGVFAGLGVWCYKKPGGPKSAISDCFGGHAKAADEPDAVEKRRLLHQEAINPTDLPTAQQCYANVTLDRAENKYLKIVKDRILRDADTQFPDGEKVTCLTTIRGTPGFSSGQHYWEVSLQKENIGIKTSWWVGVTSAAVIPRELDFTSTSSDGFWFLSSSADGFQFSTEPRVALPVSSRPQTVGVYLNQDSGELSFYDVERRSLIGSLTGAFRGQVFPLFNPGKGDKTPMEILHRETAQAESADNNSVETPASDQDGAAKE